MILTFSFRRGKMKVSINPNSWLVLLVFSLGLGCVSFAGQIIYVDAGAAGNNDGTSWVDAYNYLQDAMAVASSGEEIWVTEGIYKPNLGSKIELDDRNATFQLKNGVAIYGGFPSGGGRWEHRNPSVYETILSGDLNGDDAELTATAGLLTQPSRADNSYNVVTGSETDATTVLNGFTIIGGNAGKGKGGGVYNHSGSPTVTNCTFIENTAKCGAGMYNEKKSNPTVTNCTFLANAAKCCGGGMRNSDSNPVLTNCTFTDNSAGECGGGMRNSYSNPTLTGCIFSTNSTLSEGAAIYNYRCSPTLTSCTFIGNSAAGRAGGMYNCSSNPTLVNCEFSGNSTQKDGGAMFNCACESNPTLVNCTITGNSAKYCGGGLYSRNKSNPTLTNCILWGNSDRDGTGESAQIHGVRAVVNYCCVQKLTGDLGGIGNIAIDPLFVRSANNGGDGLGDDPCTLDLDEGANDDFGVLYLSSDSPCVDTGDNKVVSSSVVVDLDGKARILDGNGDGIATVDMGAYEYER